MAQVNATLAGKRVTSARVTLPKWGIWYAHASVDGDVNLTGRVELKIADLTLRGTILSGGPSKGRSEFRIAGGAAGWARTIPSKSYANDLEVKASTVLVDAAQAVGETIDTTSFSATERLGPAYVRPDGPASRALELYAPSRWYVGEDGITRIGSRPATTLPAGVTRVAPVDRARGSVELASDSIARILPGVIVDGLEAVDVEHSISADGGLRSFVLGKLAGTSSRRLSAWRALYDQIDPDRRFRGAVEYYVVTQEGERLNLEPVRVSTGMPALRRVPVRPGVSGARSDVALGSRVIVIFLDSRPSRPVVVGFAEADGEGFTPILTEINASTVVKLADGTRPMPATGDLAGGIWPIAGTTRVLG